MEKMHLCRAVISVPGLKKDRGRDVQDLAVTSQWGEKNVVKAHPWTSNQPGHELRSGDGNVCV